MKKIAIGGFLLYIAIIPATSSAFYDVSDQYEFKTAINFLQEKNIIQGYSDGTYRPFNILNRAELLKIAIQAKYGIPSEFSGQKCFSDLDPDAWYIPYVCYAKSKGIVEGYNDGTFKPSQNISAVEALKIGMVTNGLNYTKNQNPWYANLVSLAKQKRFVSSEIDGNWNQEINRGQMADMITRIMKYENATLDAYLQILEPTPQPLIKDSEPYDQTSVSAPQSLTAPILQSPANGALVNGNIKYSWNSVPGAVSYRLSVSRNQDVDEYGSYFYVNQIALGNSTSYDYDYTSYAAKLSTHTNVFWKVFAYNNNGDKIASTESYFILNPSSPQSVSKPNDLSLIYKQKPSNEVIQQIRNDFNINWIDNGSTATWPSEFDFNQKSSNPSKTVIMSRLNILKNQTFSEPLPFTNLSIYDYLKSNTKKININLNCDLNSDGGSAMNLNSSAGNWFWLLSGTCSPTETIAPYVSQLMLLVHEARHSESGDSGHVELSCRSIAGDPYLENGSGYSYAAMYLMWVYKYGINDPPNIKEEAENEARDLLKTRFCNKPTHSNPKVQAIINELLP